MLVAENGVFMAAALIIRDLTAFPVAWLSGESYQDVKTKAQAFIRSAIRVAFAGGVIYALYKGQYFYCQQRKFVMPVRRLAITLARMPVSIEPISLLINVALIATSASLFRRGVYGIWLIGQVFNPAGFKNPRPFFSATIRKDALKIDPYMIFANLVLNLVPEAQLGTGIYLSVFGVSQLAAFTFGRLNLQEAPTELALKGILHLVIGFDCIGMYEKNSRQLETGENKKKSIIYKISDRLALWLTFLATGR